MLGLFTDDWRPYATVTKIAGLILYTKNNKHSFFWTAVQRPGFWATESRSNLVGTGLRRQRCFKYPDTTSCGKGCLILLVICPQITDNAWRQTLTTLKSSFVQMPLSARAAAFRATFTLVMTTITHTLFVSQCICTLNAVAFPSCNTSQLIRNCFNVLLINVFLCFCLFTLFNDWLMETTSLLLLAAKFCFLMTLTR